jgi:hypothetical protein
VHRLLRKLLFRDPEKVEAIPIGTARLCLGCENVIGDQVCPICLSRTQVVLWNIVGTMKTKSGKKGGT